MSETLLRVIEVGAFIIAALLSLGVGLQLRRNAKVHEESVHTLDEKVERARAASARL